MYKSKYDSALYQSAIASYCVNTQVFIMCKPTFTNTLSRVCLLIANHEFSMIMNGKL